MEPNTSIIVQPASKFVQWYGMDTRRFMQFKTLFSVFCHPVQWLAVKGHGMSVGSGHGMAGCSSHTDFLPYLVLSNLLLFMDVDRKSVV